MAVDEDSALCYNKGCGQNFNPKENKPDACRHHPGAPVFHDAYKGWSCCNKKCTDFTEFLNIKGCTLGYHSNVKPAEPEKRKDLNPLGKDEVIEVRAPLPPAAKDRPPFDSPMVSLKTEIGQSLRSLLAKTSLSNSGNTSEDNSIQITSIPDPTNIPAGITCKNNSCKAIYGSDSEKSPCYHHPGVPVFHEGLKFWTCCQKRTTDFNVFLEQPGCTTASSHRWINEKVTRDSNAKGQVDCRLDWHQTGSDVYVTVYAKKCIPSESSITANPVRLFIRLSVSEQNGYYTNDIHLAGLVDIENSLVTYFGTKVEIRLPKAEIGKWTRLEFKKPSSKAEGDKNTELLNTGIESDQKEITTLDNDLVESVNLDEFI